MKRLLLAPLFLIFLISCSNQKNKIFSGEWISYEEINKIEAPRKGGKVDYKFIDCINNICQYKIRIDSAVIGKSLTIVKVYCDTLEKEQIDDFGKTHHRKALNFDKKTDTFALEICRNKS